MDSDFLINIDRVTVALIRGYSKENEKVKKILEIKWSCLNRNTMYA